MANKYKVLIIDDSALIRQVLNDILSGDPELEVVGAARDAESGMKMIQALKPDVLTLDIVMPGMDGLTFLERLMKSQPMPVVMMSTLTLENAPETFRALELGAVEVITKPKMDIHAKLEEMSIRIIDTVKAAAQSKIKSQQQLFLHSYTPRPAPALSLPTPSKKVPGTKGISLIAIGASTGGTDALRDVLVTLPLEIPGIVIVQHMPALFTGQFAQRLDRQCKIRVKEAAENDQILPGTALIAPGDRHMTVVFSSRGFCVHLEDSPLYNRHRPSVDVLFHSVATCVGSRAVGVILTGMGADGALGMAAMKKAGARTIAQDEASCVVFGMPKMAIKEGGVDHVSPLAKIPEQIMKLLES